MAQWLRIHLLMQGTRVRALVREDPTLKKKIKKNLEKSRKVKIMIIIIIINPPVVPHPLSDSS